LVASLGPTYELTDKLGEYDKRLRHDMAFVLALPYDGKKCDGKNITIADVQTSIFDCLNSSAAFQADPSLCLIWPVLLQRHDKEVDLACDAFLIATSVAEVSSIAQPTEPTLGMEPIPSSSGVQQTSLPIVLLTPCRFQPLLTAFSHHNRLGIKTIHRLHLSHLCSSMVMILDRL
jgi:hypothetical protein